MNGFEVCQRLKENKTTQNIPIIFLTAKSDEQSIQKGFDLGGVDYITKPFRPKELFSRINVHIKLIKHKKEAQELHKFKALNELIRDISHQWRQPLSVISTAASSSKLQKQMGILTDEEFYCSCDSILKSSDYLSSTLEQFRNLIEQSIEKKSFNLKDIIEKNLILFKKEQDCKCEITIDIEKDIIINGISNQLIEVILHFIKNSRQELEKNNQKNRLLFLYGKKEKDFAIINFYDNAGGIPQDIIDKIFDPYFTTKHKAQGIGLSLYSAYNIITRIFDGFISVSNVNFEFEDSSYKGAKFEIKIPLN